MRRALPSPDRERLEECRSLGPARPALRARAGALDAGGGAAPPGSTCGRARREPLAARFRAELCRLGVRSIPRGPRAATRQNPAGLSARQVEVLGLVAEGLTNAEIARRPALPRRRSTTTSRRSSPSCASSPAGTRRRPPRSRDRHERWGGRRPNLGELGPMRPPGAASYRRITPTRTGGATEMISPNPITELAGWERSERRPPAHDRQLRHADSTPRALPAAGSARDGRRPRRDVGLTGHTHRRPGRTRARRDAQLRRHTRLGRVSTGTVAGPISGSLRAEVRGRRPLAQQGARVTMDWRVRAGEHSFTARLRGAVNRPHAARRPGRTRHVGLHGRHRRYGCAAAWRTGAPAMLVGTLTLVGHSSARRPGSRPPLRARLGDPPRGRPRDELGRGLPTSRSTAGRSATPSSKPSPTRSC